LVRIGTLAAGVGAFAGLWITLITYIGHSCPPSVFCALENAWGPYTPILSALLIVVSLACFVGPRQLFYGSAALALLIGVSIVLSSTDPFDSIVALGLAAVAFVLALLAARHEGRVSEQANPMNLPVFG
jgi:hypothetical protein